METVSITRVLGLFQECRKSGQFAVLHLETRGSAVTATFSVRCENGNRKEEEEKPRRRITPSRRRRNFHRRKAWLEKKQGNEEHSNASIPAENASVVVENVPEEAVKGPVWNIDPIPQLDGSPEPSENTEDEETFPEFLEQIRMSDFNASDDIDDTEDCLSKILDENNIIVKNLEFTVNLKCKKSRMCKMPRPVC